MENNVKTRGPLAEQLFIYKGCEVVGDKDVVFYDLELKEDVGKYKAGKKFVFCKYCEEESTVEFFENFEDKKGTMFGLRLTTEEL